MSCGGWVTDVLKNNPFVRHIVVVGASDDLIAQIPVELRAKVLFYSQAEIDHHKALPSKAGKLKHEPVYVSIDLPESVINLSPLNMMPPYDGPCAISSGRFLFVCHKLNNSHIVPIMKREPEAFWSDIFKVVIFFIAFVAYLMSYAKRRISLKIKSLKHNNAQRKEQKALENWKNCCIFAEDKLHLGIIFKQA